MKITSAFIAFIITLVSVPEIACAQESDVNFWYLCEGNNYTVMGSTFDHVRIAPFSLGDAVRNEEDNIKVLKFMNREWARNRPADTWSCKSTQSDNEMARVATYWNNNNYQVYMEGEKFASLKRSDVEKMDKNGFINK